MSTEVTRNAALDLGKLISSGKTINLSNQLVNSNNMDSLFSRMLNQQHGESVLSVRKQDPVSAEDGRQRLNSNTGKPLPQERLPSGKRGQSADKTHQKAQVQEYAEAQKQRDTTRQQSRLDQKMQTQKHHTDAQTSSKQVANRQLTQDQLENTQRDKKDRIETGMIDEVLTGEPVLSQGQKNALLSEARLSLEESHTVPDQSDSELELSINNANISGKNVMEMDDVITDVQGVLADFLDGHPDLKKSINDIVSGFASVAVSDSDGAISLDALENALGSLDQWIKNALLEAKSSESVSDDAMDKVASLLGDLQKRMDGLTEQAGNKQDSQALLALLNQFAVVTDDVMPGVMPDTMQNRLNLAKPEWVSTIPREQQVEVNDLEELSGDAVSDSAEDGNENGFSEGDDSPSAFEEWANEFETADTKNDKGLINERFVKVVEQQERGGGSPVQERLAALAKHIDKSLSSSVMPTAEKSADSLEMTKTSGFQRSLEQISQIRPGTKTPVFQLAQPLQSREWASELGQRMMMMVSSKIQSAELHLNPKELGPIDVKVKIQQDQASVVFTSQVAQTRDALEQALPRLKEMLEQNGVDLGQADVNEQAMQQFSHDNNTESHDSREQGADDALADDVVSETSALVKSVGLVDYYA